jgi:hypothetical protein
MRTIFSAAIVVGSLDIIFALSAAAAVNIFKSWYILKQRRVCNIYYKTDPHQKMVTL